MKRRLLLILAAVVWQAAASLDVTRDPHCLDDGDPILTGTAPLHWPPSADKGIPRR
jgi:hypothetical protein